MLPEPARGGQSRLQPGATEIIADGRGPVHRARPNIDEEPRRRPGAVHREIAAQKISPRLDLVLDVDPAQMNLWQAVRYVLRVPTNVALIVVSALGPFFQSGVRTFAVIFVGYQYSISQGLATSLLAVLAIGAIAGVLASGRLADGLAQRGHIAGRVVVAGGAFPLASVLFLPPLLSRSLVIGIPFCCWLRPRSRLPIRRLMRRGWRSCPPACGAARRVCTRCCERSPRPWPGCCWVPLRPSGRGIPHGWPADGTRPARPRRRIA